MQPPAWSGHVGWDGRKGVKSGPTLGDQIRTTERSELPSLGSGGKCRQVKERAVEIKEISSVFFGRQSFALDSLSRSNASPWK